MANRINRDQSTTVDKLDNINNPALAHLSSQGTQTRHIQNVDDVIVSLANAYENRRARQASEWERIGHQGFHRLN